MIDRLGIGGCTRSVFVSEPQLTYLYKHAACFVYPSLYEGFGIPILEAYASGCPLALSDASCFPEVARDGGAYFDPYNVESMADTMRRLISDTHLCETLVARGREILASYSWDKMARETAAPPCDPHERAGGTLLKRNKWRLCIPALSDSIFS